MGSEIPTYLIISHGRVVGVKPGFAWFLFAYFVLVLDFVLLTVLINIASIESSFDFLRGRNSLKSSFKRAFQVYFSYIFGEILFIIAFLSPLLLFFIAMICCLFALIVPFLMIYVGIRLMFFSPAVVIFKKGAIESLMESWELTDGRVIEIGVLLLIVFAIYLPFIAIYKMFSSNLAAQIVFSAIFAFMAIWLNVFTTLIYLQLKDIYGPDGFVEKGTHHEEKKAILLVGFSDEELDNIRSAGLPAYGISEDAEYEAIKSILQDPMRYSGNTMKTPERVAIIHGFSGDELPAIMNTINFHAKGDVKYAMTTETSLEWTLRYLLKEIGG